MALHLRDFLPTEGYKDLFTLTVILILVGLFCCLFLKCHRSLALSRGMHWMILSPGTQ